MTLPDNITILKRRDDGTLLGADSEGNLYDGVYKKVPHTAFVIENIITPTDDGDDEVIERFERAEGVLVSKSTLTRNAYVAGRKAFFLQNVRTTKDEPISEATAQTMAEQAWAEEQSLTKHKAAYETIVRVDADGNETTASREIGKVVLVWKPKGGA
jgi:hypothetical protein